MAFTSESLRVTDDLAPRAPKSSIVMGIRRNDVFPISSFQRPLSASGALGACFILENTPIGSIRVI